MPGYYSLDSVGIAAGYIEQERRREAQEQRLLRIVDDVKRTTKSPRRGRQLTIEIVPSAVICDMRVECW